MTFSKPSKNEVFYNLTFDRLHEYIFITSLKNNYRPITEIYSLDPICRIRLFRAPESQYVEELELVSTRNGVIIFYCTYNKSIPFQLVVRELTNNSSAKIWQGKMPILNFNYLQQINPSKTKIVFSYDSKDGDQNGLLMMDVKTHEVKSLTTDSAKIYHHCIVKWISDHKLVFASQAEGQDDWSLFFMSF